MVSRWKGREFQGEWWYFYQELWPSNKDAQAQHWYAFRHRFHYPQEQESQNHSQILPWNELLENPSPAVQSCRRNQQVQIAASPLRHRQGIVRLVLEQDRDRHQTLHQPGGGNCITSGCQISWRKAEFQCTVTYGTFCEKDQPLLFRLFLRSRNIQKNKALNVPRIIVPWNPVLRHHFWHPLVVLSRLQKIIHIFLRKFKPFIFSFFSLQNLSVNLIFNDRSNRVCRSEDLRKTVLHNVAHMPDMWNYRSVFQMVLDVHNFVRCRRWKARWFA